MLILTSTGIFGHGTGFDRRSRFGQNVLIFGVDMSFSAHIDNKKKDILALGKGPTLQKKCTRLILLFSQKRNFV